MAAPQPRGEAADYYQNTPPQGGYNNNYGNPQYHMQNPQDKLKIPTAAPGIRSELWSKQWAGSIRRETYI